MKVYKEVRINIDTGMVVYEDSFEYDGCVALAKGGSQVTNTVDKDYNRRMARIAEQQQDMADEYFKFWEQKYKPFEEEQIAANQRLLPTLTHQAEVESRFAASGIEKMMERDSNNRTLLDYTADAKRGQAQVARKAYDEALKGIDVNREVSMARADVTNSYKGAQGAMARDFGRYGVNTSSEGFAKGIADLNRDRVKGIASAMTTARVSAQDRNFDRLKTASQIGIGG